MKKLYYTLFLLYLTQVCIAQIPGRTSNTSIIGKYYWNHNVAISACDLEGNITKIDSNRRVVLSTGNQLFFVVGIKTIDKEDYAIIRILDYNQKKQLKNFFDYNFDGSSIEYADYVKMYPNSNNYGVYQRYFSVKASDLLQNSIPYTYIAGALAGGVINFPFKLRLQKDANDFSSAFNLGAAFGYTFPHYSFRNFTYSFLFAAAIANVNLDASSVTRNVEMLSSTNDFSALTFAIGGLVQYDRFQAGVFLGIDRLGKLNNDTFNWRYQNKPWVSIGFGYSIFTVEREAVNTNTNQP